MTGRRIVVAGSGALARAVTGSLAALAGAGRETTTVTVLARDVAAAARLALAGRARAAVTGTSVTFAAAPLAEAAAVLRREQPAVLLCCVSEQSPYEKVTGPSAWTALIAEAGFGITLPLQATIAAHLAATVARVSPATQVVNGAFPDAVNPLLSDLGWPVLCGIGNVSTLAACLSAELGPDRAGRLAVLGHHAHLDGTAGEVRAWAGDTPVTGITAKLAGYRALPRPELNAVGGHAAARLALDLAAGAEIRVSVPGPLGLPGGYPVRIAAGRAELDLPAGLTRAEAIDENLRAGRPDGVSVLDGEVRYTPEAAAALAAHLPHRADGWAPADLDQVSHEFAAVRQRLRRMPPVPAAAGPA